MSIFRKLNVKRKKSHVQFTEKDEILSQMINERVGPSVNYNADYNKILKCLLCPIPGCHNYLSSPVEQCTHGHCVCVDCKSEKCPICQRGMIETINKKLNEIVERILVPCVNKKVGCRLQFPRTIIDSHENKCPYGVICCMQKDCSWTGSHTALWDHTIQCHKGSTCSISSCTNTLKLNDTNTHYNCTVFSVYESIFVGLLIYSAKNNNVFGLVQLQSVLVRSDNLSFNYEIIHVNRNNVAKTLYCRAVHDMEEEIADIMKEETCFVSTLSGIEEMSNPVSSTLRLRITSLRN